MIKLSQILTLGLLIVFSAQAKSFQIDSPDGTISTKIEISQTGMSYQITKDGKTVVYPSKLGVMIRDRANLDQDMEILQSSSYSSSKQWETVWGENKTVENNYNARVFKLKHAPSEIEMSLYFKVFNDGVAFQYLWDEQPLLKAFEIWDELTEFNLGENHKAWWIPAFLDNRYEYLYTHSKTQDLNVVHTPFTAELTNGKYVAIHEANLRNYSSMALKNIGGGKLKADLFPWPDGTRVKGSTPLSSSWRTIHIGNRAGDLTESTMVLNLNEPSTIRNTEWIKTGKYIGIWWGMHIRKFTWGTGPKLGANTQNTMDYIDFAAEHGFDGVLVEGWNTGWDGNWFGNGALFRFAEPNPYFDIDLLSAYAARKNVRLVGHHETASITTNYEGQLDDAFRFYQKQGVQVVKTGYVGTRLDYSQWHHGQYAVKHYNKVTKEAAKRKLMLVVHEPIKQTGLRRTYPNLMSTEGARGQEYDAWSGKGGNPPDHTTILPFTRMLAGPMDFTPGTFDLHFTKYQDSGSRVSTTLAKQLALYIVIYSPWQMASDLPENYLKFPEAFEFIKRVPTDWSQSVTVDGKIGDYAVIARKDRNSEKWYLGAVSDEQRREVNVELDFLDSSKTYTVRAYQDARDASWEENPYAMDIYTTTVKGGSDFNLYLASGGGLALEFIPQ